MPQVEKDGRWVEDPTFKVRHVFEQIETHEEGNARPEIGHIR